jgi:N-methylhydantoinase A
MHTIGAGGGSMGWIDPGGMLRVGPESAGAEPGPACYGGGGTTATVTDANLVLGRLLPEAFLGGAMVLDVEAAREALARLGAGLGLTAVAAARGVIRVANENMARALRVISVGRGVDPRGMALASFGGAGGLHVCALAEALGMGRALVPFQSGVLSALGMLVAPAGRQLARTCPGLVAAMDPGTAEALAAELEAAGREAMTAEGVAPESTRAERTLDLRYRGQSFTLNLPWDGPLAGMEEAFHRAHRARYGHAMEVPVELVNLRVALHGPAALPGELPRGAMVAGAPRGAARVDGVDAPVPVWDRGSLAPGRPVTGPALVVETVATTYVAPGWRAVADPWGNLLLERG